MSEHSHLLPRYKQLRELAPKLNSRLFRTLQKSEIEEGGKKLGILKKKRLELDTQDEVALLSDYCIHDVRRQGLNAVERYLAEVPPPADSDEMVLLQSLRQAWFSLLAVEGIEPGVGVHFRDLFYDQSLFLVDIGFSQTASPGMILAARVMSLEGFNQTTGAALPAGDMSGERGTSFLQGVKALFKDRDPWQRTPEQRSELTATVLRTLLQRGAAHRIKYIEPEQASTLAERQTAPPPARRTGRNDPCPCGSGRKYKQCCGKNR